MNLISLTYLRPYSIFFWNNKKCRLFCLLIMTLGISCESFANEDKHWLVRDVPVIPDVKLKNWGIAALYLDIQQPNVVLSILAITESSLESSYRDIDTLRFKGSKSKPSKIDLSGRKDIVYINLPEGLYQISQIDVPHFDLPYKLSTDNAPNWRFRVTKNHVNYIGKLEVDAVRSKNTINTVLINQYAQYLEDLTLRLTQASIDLPLKHGVGYQDPYAEYLKGIE